MSEPIILYRDGDEVTVYAPSVALDLQAQGWSLQPTGGIWANNDDSDDVPFDFAPEDDTQEVDVVPVKVKRGRPRKATK